MMMMVMMMMMMMMMMMITDMAMGMALQDLVTFRQAQKKTLIADTDAQTL